MNKSSLLLYVALFAPHKDEHNGAEIIGKQTLIGSTMQTKGN